MTPEKKELIDEGKHHEQALSADMVKEKDRDAAIGYLIRCVRTQMFTECVTVEDCEQSKADQVKNCAALRAACPGQKQRFGWPACVAAVTALGVVVGLIHKFVE